MLINLYNDCIKTNDVLDGCFEQMSNRSGFQLIANSRSAFLITRKQQVFSIFKHSDNFPDVVIVRSKWQDSLVFIINFNDLLFILSHKNEHHPDNTKHHQDDEPRALPEWSRNQLNGGIVTS